MPGKFYQYCHYQKKVVPVENVMQRSPNAQIDHNIMTDEMVPTRHPVTGETYTCKTKYLAKTKELGFEVVGTAWDKDILNDHAEYDKQKETDHEKFHDEKIRKDFRENLNDDGKRRAILEKREFFRRNGHY